MVIQNKHYDVAYSLGIYVDGWWGGESPCIFGTKKRISEIQ